MGFGGLGRICKVGDSAASSAMCGSGLGGHELRVAGYREDPPKETAGSDL